MRAFSAELPLPFRSVGRRIYARGEVRYSTMESGAGLAF
jgi:hypothetical protein